MKIRFWIFQYAVYLGLAALVLGLFRVQVLDGQRYRELSEKNRIRLIPLEAPRGRVFDTQGRLLASNRTAFNVVATPEDVTPEVFPMLADLLDMTEEKVRVRMSAPREYPFTPALIKEDIPKDLVFKLEELRPELPGVSIQVMGLRSYPYEQTAAHLIGYIGKINPKEYRQFDRERFGMTSLLGRAGIEKVYDDRLRGWRGGRQIEVDAQGDLVRVLSEKMPEPGEDIHITLDLEFQKAMDKLIEGKKASIAVLDLETEGLMALSSSPSYDPNIFVSPRHSHERLDVLRSPDAPLLHRGTGSSYPPGSVFKVVTALAALEQGKITPNTHVNCKGWYQIRKGTRKFKCWLKGGHGSLNLYQAIERSCNVYFYKLGALLKADEISKYARELGLGMQMKLEATQLAPGLVPDSAWKKNKYKERWYTGDTLSYAIGQSYLLTSPIQILRLTSIIAKNGERVEPKILVEDVQNEKESDKQKIAVKEANIKAIKKSMLRVVESDFGTGQFARVDFNKMAAKTGTAQVPLKTAHSWMTGFFPYNNPKIAFVVMLEHGGPAGIKAAKVVKDMINTWNQMYGTSMV